MPQTNSLPPVYGPNTTVQVKSPKKRSSIPAGVAGAVVGATVAGTAAGIWGNPYFKNKEVVNSFAEKSFKNFLDKNSTQKDVLNKIKNFLKELEKIKTPEELKTLFTNNNTIAEDYCKILNITLDDYIKTITSDNLAGNKKAISDTISQQCKNKIQLMKNWIQKCWDSSAKEFKKADGISDDVFNSIKEATKGCKLKMVALYAGIAAAITGVACYATHRFTSKKKQANAA